MSGALAWAIAPLVLIAVASMVGFLLETNARIDALEDRVAALEARALALERQALALRTTTDRLTQGRDR